MRNKIVKFADKDIDVKEKKIGELEILVRELFPATKGKLKNLDKALNDLELDWICLKKNCPGCSRTIRKVMSKKLKWAAWKS